jgi:hypothetical protein
VIKISFCGNKRRQTVKGFEATTLVLSEKFFNHFLSHQQKQKARKYTFKVFRGCAFFKCMFRPILSAKTDGTLEILSLGKSSNYINLFQLYSDIPVLDT